jgi:hypothetical protein
MRLGFPMFFEIDESDERIYKDSGVFPPAAGDRPGILKPNNAEKFLLAMAYGFHNHARLKLSKRDSAGFARTEYIHEEGEALIDAIATIETGSLETILDAKRVVTVVEEYAHGGVTLLGQRAAQAPRGTLMEEIELELLDQLEQGVLADADPAG